MDKIVPAIRHYSWGSRTLIPQLQGQEPSTQPIAELWYGAHPGDPSMVDGRGLDSILSEHPEYLGEWGSKGLPFLLKILAADEVLSLQAHPSAAQAVEGFEKENALGLALDDTQRNYKDASHKPEVIVALTPFYAMAGFRPLVHTRELFAELNCPELDRYLSMLEDGADAEESNLRALFTTWITIPATARRELIDSLMAAASTVVEAGTAPEWMRMTLRTVVEINEQYPGDIGVLGALLLNHVELNPGEAIFVDAGQLHAYVRGLGVEIMANSDNVLRGGLTPKYVDVPELVKVLKFSALDEPRAAAIPGGDAASGVEYFDYPAPVEEFDIRRIVLPAGAEFAQEINGPSILLCTHGEVAAAAGGNKYSLAPSEAVFIPATESGLRLRATNDAQVFLAHA